MTSADLEKTVGMLTRNQIRFILIGGWAAALHGSARTTLDVDVVYARDRENVRNLATALQPHSPYLRGAPAGLPFVWDERTIRNGLPASGSSRCNGRPPIFSKPPSRWSDARHS